MILPVFISKIIDRILEPSTMASAGGGLAVFVWAGENRDFLDYLQDRPVVAIVLVLFALGVLLKERGDKHK